MQLLQRVDRVVELQTNLQRFTTSTKLLPWPFTHHSRDKQTYEIVLWVSYVATNNAKKNKTCFIPSLSSEQPILQRSARVKNTSSALIPPKQRTTVPKQLNSGFVQPPPSTIKTRVCIGLIGLTNSSGFLSRSESEPSPSSWTFKEDTQVVRGGRRAKSVAVTVRS